MGAGHALPAHLHCGPQSTRPRPSLHLQQTYCYPGSFSPPTMGPWTHSIKAMMRYPEFTFYHKGEVNDAVN